MQIQMYDSAKVGALFTFPFVIASRSFQSSAAFLMESFVHTLHLIGTASSSREFFFRTAHFSLELLVSTRDKP